MKTYKIEVKLTKEQKELFRVSKNVCRFVYNEFIAVNKIMYEQYQLGNSNIKFMSAYSFSKYLNNVLIPIHGWSWVKEAPSKSVTQSIINAETAFKKFFKKQTKFPRFKKRTAKIGIYLPKNNKADFMKILRNKIKIPVFGYVHLKEFGRLPLDVDISSCTVTQTADRYFISFLVKTVEVKVNYSLTENVIGLDMGLAHLVTTSEGVKYESPNKITKFKKLRRKLKREQRKLSRKYEQNKNKEISYCNINKQIVAVQRLHAQISRTLKSYQNNIIDALVRTKPKAFVIEDLNIKGMMKNRCLSKAIGNSGWYQFSKLLRMKCEKYGIELIKVDKFFPSSKLCSSCGEKKLDLKLTDRTFKCNCGFELDRDHNAALNLMFSY